MQLTNKRKFRSINAVLTKVLENHDLVHLHYIEEIRKNWKDFDKTIASHSEPINFDNKSGTLYLKIENEMWKKEFLINKETLKVKIKNAFRNISIKNIVIS